MDILDNPLDATAHVGKTEDSVESEDVQLVQEDDGTDQLTVAGVAGQTLALDASGQFFRADTGQGPVTYRVVQVTQNEDGQAQVLTTGIPVSQLDQAQAVIQSPFNGTPDSPSTNEVLQQETRFTYVPSVTAAAETPQPAVDLNSAGLTLDAGGQFYVMMSPQDVLQAANQRVIAPRTSVTPRVETTRSSRDERRRSSHNEVERRRRDKINNWIVQLSKLIPDCGEESGKMTAGSKGGILAKACDYINSLKQQTTLLSEAVKDTERLTVDNEILRSQIEELKSENQILRTQLHQHGIVSADLTNSTS